MNQLQYKLVSIPESGISVARREASGLYEIYMCLSIPIIDGSFRVEKIIYKLSEQPVLIEGQEVYKAEPTILPTLSRLFRAFSHQQLRKDGSVLLTTLRTRLSIWMGNQLVSANERDAMELFLKLVIVENGLKIIEEYVVGISLR